MRQHWHRQHFKITYHHKANSVALGFSTIFENLVELGMCDPSIASATVMCMTALPPQTERNRQDRSACCAEKRRHQARSRRVRGPIRPAPAVCATTDTAQSEKRLLNSQNRAILTSDGRPLRVCRITNPEGLLTWNVFLEPMKIWNLHRLLRVAQCKHPSCGATLKQVLQLCL